MSKILQERTEDSLVVLISGYGLNDYKEYQEAGMKLVYADRRTLIFVKTFVE